MSRHERRVVVARRLGNAVGKEEWTGQTLEADCAVFNLTLGQVVVFLLLLIRIKQKEGYIRT